MPKKANKKVSKKEESDDDYEVEDDIEDVEDVDEEEFDEAQMDIECDIPDDDMLEVKITRCNAFVSKNF